MDIGLPHLQLFKDFPDVVEIVNGPFHGGADVGDDNGGGVGVDLEGLPQVVVVHLTVLLAPDHNATHVEDAEELDDAVVSVL